MTNADVKNVENYRLVIKGKIKETVKVSITEYAKKTVRKKVKFQILDLIMPKERKVRSIVGGLETSLGTTLWEPLAKVLAKSNGFNVITDKLLCPVNMPSALSNTLQMIIEDRKQGRGLYNALKSHEEIKRVCQTFISRPIDQFEKPPRGRGVDIWLEKGGVNYFFDTKTVQPNLSALIGCMEQVINWYAYFYARNPDGNAEGRIVFPYNPNPGSDFWNGLMGGGRPLEPSVDAWVENEFWDFCSGIENTYGLIVDSFHELSQSGELEESLNKILG